MTQNIFSGCTLTAPDVALAFSNAWCSIADSTGTAATAVIACSGISNTISFANGAAIFSLLAYIRNAQQQQANMFPANAASKLAHTLSMQVTIKNASGSTLGTATYSQPAIYGAQDIAGAYAGERWITYNAAVTDSCISFMVGENGADFDFGGTMALTINSRGVMQNEKISRFVGATAPDNITITSTQTLGTSGDVLSTMPLVVHVTRDKRTTGITNVRWIDAAGMVNYRTFATGSRTTAAATTSSYNKPVYNTKLQSGINTGKELWVNKSASSGITFGDDAVPAEQYEWIASLYASTLVEVQVNGVWTRCTIEDAEISIPSRKHLFNCSAVAVLPSVEVQQW